MTAIVFFFYKWLIAPLAWLLLQIARPFLWGKVREMIDDKNRGYAELKTGTRLSSRPVWIHAASGEIEYARPLIRELKKRHPEISILVTYSSPSAKKILRQISEVDAWAALPWDLPLSLSRFLRRWQPRQLLVARTDVWPVMAQAARNHGIPGVLFSATFAENSSRLRGLSRYLTRASLDRLDKVFCVNEQDEINLLKLGLRTPIEVLGDTRFDQVLYRLQHPKPVALPPRPLSLTFIMGSTWPEDERALVPAIAELAQLPAQFIMAPHEVHGAHLQELEKSLTSHGLRHQRYSQFQSWEGTDVLIIDQVGILAELYKFGDVAFVGGSFRKQVHSVMEPLAAGLPVLVGPHHLNNREALDFQTVVVGGVPLVQCVQNSHDIATAVKRVKASDLARLKPGIVDTIYRRTGVTEKVLEKINLRL